MLVIASTNYKHALTIIQSIQQPYYTTPMARVVSAISLWGSPKHRRAEVLSECLFYGVGMMIIGVVLTLLVATGTFPASHEVMMASRMLAVYLDTYLMCALAGLCAYVAARLARSALKSNGSLTVAKLVLVFGAVTLMVSIALTIVAFVKQENAPGRVASVPAWVIAIQSLLLVLCLMFLSLLVMAFYTLSEADNNADIACIVAGDTLPVIAVHLPGEAPHLPLDAAASTAAAPYTKRSDAGSMRADQRPLADAGMLHYPPQALTTTLNMPAETASDQISTRQWFRSQVMRQA